MERLFAVALKSMSQRLHARGAFEPARRLTVSSEVAISSLWQLHHLPSTPMRMLQSIVMPRSV